MSYGGNSFLFMGDAEAEVEASRTWQPADVLKWGTMGQEHLLHKTLFFK